MFNVNKSLSLFVGLVKSTATENMFAPGPFAFWSILRFFFFFFFFFFGGGGGVRGMGRGVWNANLYLK